MNYLVCSIEADPCPAANVRSVPFLETVDWTAMGVTAESILWVFSWGFAAVFMFWLLGYAASIAIATIRKT